MGDGTATANATIVAGVYTYPGRFLNDDGFLSSENYLENRDYYQSFSYVVRTNKAIDKYRKYLKDLLHPAGMKLFGEYLSVDDTSVSQEFQSTNTVQSIFVSGTYKANYIPSSTNTFVEISTQRNVSTVLSAYIEFINNATEYANLSLRVDPNYDGVLSTTGNLVRSVSSANTANVEFKMFGANQTKLSLVRSTNVSNTSNLEIQTSAFSNTVQLVNYTYVGNTSNLQLHIGKGDKQTNANLVVYTVVSSTSNLEIQTAEGYVNTNTISIVKYTNIGLMSNVKVNTLSGAAITQLNLVRQMVATLTTSNLTVNTGIGTTTNTISLIRLQTNRQQTNLAMNTVSQYSATNRINLLKFNPVMTMSNLVITTPVVFDTDTISLQNLVPVGVTSNLQIQTGYGDDSSNTSRIIRFVNFTQINQEANIVVSTPLTGANGNTSYLIIGKYFPINNTSNLRANSSIGATTNGVLLSRTVQSSNVTIGEGYIINIGGAYTVNVVSIASNSRSIVISPSIPGNLKLQTIKVISYTPTQTLATSNVLIENGYTISVNGNNYTVNSASQSNNVIFIDGNIAVNITSANVFVRSYYKTQWRQNSNVALSDKFTVNVGSKNTITIYSSSANSEVAYLYHAIPGNTNNATMLVVSQYRDVRVNNSNVSFANNYTLSIAGNNYVVFGISNTSNAVRITPNIIGSIVGNTVNVQSFYSTVNKSNSNVAFDVGYTLNVDGSQYKVLNSNANSSIITITPSLPGSFFSNVLTVDTYYQDHWVANSNVALNLGYRLNIASNTHIITSMSQTSNVITITPAITGNLVNATMNIEPYYREEWVANSNVTFDVGYTINIGSANTVKVVSFSPNSSLINVSANVLGNLAVSTLNVISHYRSLTPAVSNVPFDNGYKLNINGSNTVTITGYSATSNTLTITPAINGNISNAKLIVDAYYKRQWLGNSNVFFDTGYTINASAQVSVQNTANLVVNTGTGAANAINLVYLVQTPFTSNLVVNTGTGAAVSFGNIVRLVETPNTSNITVNTSIGVANQVNLSAWAQNSNVYFAVGYSVNVGGANTVTITDYQPTSDMIEVTPALPANLTNAILRVNTKSWVDGWLGNSNVYVGNTYVVSVNGINTTVNTSSATTNNVKFDTAINGNLVGSTLTVYSRSWATANLNQSNVFIGNNYLISVNGVNTTVVSSNQSNGVLFVSPAVNAGVVGNTLKTISYSTKIQITSSNQQSDVVTISPSIKGNVDNATITVVSYYKKQWRQNSNVAFSNAYVLRIAGSSQKYTIETSSATNNEMTLTPQPPNNLANANVFVENFYTNVTLNTSNVFIDDGYVLNVNNQTVTVIRPSQTSNVVNVWPVITGTNANATIKTVSYYKNEWLQNSNSYLTVGDTLTVNGYNIVVGTATQSSSIIVFGIGLSSNTISNGTIAITRPIELSNGFYNVTSNSINSNNYIFIAEGKSVNANGFVYAGI